MTLTPIVSHVFPLSQNIIIVFVFYLVTSLFYCFTRFAILKVGEEINESKQDYFKYKILNRSGDLY